MGNSVDPDQAAPVGTNNVGPDQSAPVRAISVDTDQTASEGANSVDQDRTAVGANCRLRSNCYGSKMCCRGSNSSRRSKHCRLRPNSSYVGGNSVDQIKQLL